MRYKQVKFIPDNEQEFIDAINSKNIPDEMKQFFIESLYYTIGHVDDCDNFYIDKPYSFNLYGYSQKLKAEHILKMRSLGFKDGTEVNFFNYDKNYLKGTDHYIKLKNKIGYHDYYVYLNEKLKWFKPHEEFLIVERPCVTTLDELVFDLDVVRRLVDYIIDAYDHGLWLNNFNNYGVRYDREKKRFYAYDPDIFFVIEQNDVVYDIKDQKDFIDKYIYYKLRKKDIIYRVSNPHALTEQVLYYMYYTFWLLENMCHMMRERQ